jgi:hypothetical protein
VSGREPAVPFDPAVGFQRSGIRQPGKRTILAVCVSSDIDKGNVTVFPSHLKDILVISRDVRTLGIGKNNSPVHARPIQDSLDLIHGKVPAPDVNVSIDDFHDELL